MNAMHLLKYFPFLDLSERCFGIPATYWRCAWDEDKYWTFIDFLNSRMQWDRLQYFICFQYTINSVQCKYIRRIDILVWNSAKTSSLRSFVTDFAFYSQCDRSFEIRKFGCCPNYIISGTSWILEWKSIYCS